MSGTGTQITDLTEYFEIKRMAVRDMRKTELDALFHAGRFYPENQNYRSFQEYLADTSVPEAKKNQMLRDMNACLSDGGTNQDLKIASCVKNQVSTYVNPHSADVWIFEEPTKRGAGQVNRAIEQHRSEYENKIDPIAAAYAHQAYRVDEFLRFRRVLREEKKIILRSRSEESACYQIQDKKALPHGISEKEYLNLPGHLVAFKNPPTHIFIVCGSASWTKKDYAELRAARDQGRLVDDHERNADYMVLVNKRYASDWLEKLYKKGCGRFKVKPPQIIRFDIHASKAEIKEQMAVEIDKILKAYA